MIVRRKEVIDRAAEGNKDTDRVYLAGRLEKMQMSITEVKTEPPEISGAYEMGISEYRSFTCEKPHVHEFNDEYNYVISGAVKVYLFNEENVSRRETLLQAGDFFMIKSGEPYIAKECAGTKVLFTKVPGGNDKRILGEDEYELPEGWKDSWNEPEKEKPKPWYIKEKKISGLWFQAIMLNKGIAGGMTAAFGIMATVLSLVINNKGILATIDLTFLGIMFFCFVVMVCITYGAMNRDSYEHKAGRHRITVLKNDFIENFRKLLSSSNKMPLVVLGIDTTLDLEMSTTTGIIRNLTNYIAEHCNLSQEEFQRYIDKAYHKAYYEKKHEERTPWKEALALGEMLLVKDVPLRPDVDNKSGKLADPVYTSFLLVANSRKPDLEAIKNKEENIDRVLVADHQKIISGIFSECRRIVSEDFSMRSTLDSLLMGAIGTNGGEVPYSVVLSEILNSFEISVRKDEEPHWLFISIRKTDIESQDLTQKDMISLITTRVNQMHLKTRER